MQGNANLNSRRRTQEVTKAVEYGGILSTKKLIPSVAHPLIMSEIACEHGQGVNFLVELCKGPSSPTN